MKAMAVRQREAGGGPAGAGGVESTYAELERALREAYDVAKGKGGRAPSKPASIELGGLLVKVYAESHLLDILVFEARGRGDGVGQLPLCRVQLRFKDGEPYKFEVYYWELEELASKCARGEGCRLSWEEMENVLRLTSWAVNRLAELAGIPAKVEKVGLVKARFTRNGGPSVLPCLQVSVDGKRRSVCEWAYFRRNPSGSWGVKGIYRLVSIGRHVKMADALMELGEMVEEHIRRREREGAWRIRALGYWGETLGLKEIEYQGDFLELEKVVLRLPDGAEEVLLEPVLYKLIYLGEDFAVVKCPPRYSRSNDDKLADALRKELEEAWGVVVRAVRRYTEEHDPRYAVLAYIVVEALRKAWPSAGLA